MHAAAAPIAPIAGSNPVREVRSTTLLALVRAISEVTEDEREIVSTVLHLLRSGQVRLCGNFRNAPIEDFE